MHHKHLRKEEGDVSECWFMPLKYFREPFKNQIHFFQVFQLVNNLNQSFATILLHSSRYLEFSSIPFYLQFEKNGWNFIRLETLFFVIIAVGIFFILWDIYFACKMFGILIVMNIYGNQMV